MLSPVLATCEIAGDPLFVRRAVADDVRALAALLGADPVTAARGDSGDGDLADYGRGFAAVDADPHQLLVVLTGAEAVVGTLQISFLPGLARRGAWRGQLESVHVAASAQGRGLGSWLVGWAVDECRRRGCGLVQLTSASEREGAHRFYERLGFAASHVGFKRTL
ncbi:GNAT family N-acetyltransferase [Actinomycetospora endophytica]|uniref:GNAT family N-acetyltransferase n=1 Tax=Actinomycetospora endophytica TaxID=2291215 RepID=A0ABS8P3F0_9PSEU|nr:GNAT family N-acetyltransferase [Actinomycetospora endophytica]MCD2192781.1 GNAT family N-acetyltransferase [Actinomycetospora endophytica]